MMIPLLLLLLQNGATDRTLIKSDDPNVEIRLPDEYKMLKDKEIPSDIYKQFPNRFVRMAGEKSDWEWIRVTVRAAPEASKVDTIEDPATLSLLTYGKDIDGNVRAETAPESIMVTRSERKVAGYPARVVECRFTQVELFLAIGVQIQLPAGSFTVTIVGAADEKIEKAMRADLDLILGTVVITSHLFTKDEASAKADQLSVLTGGAVAAGVLYVLVWALYFRTHPLALHVVRMFCPGLLALAWGYAIFVGFQIRGSLVAWELDSPFLGQLYVTIPLCIAYLIATFLRAVKSQAAFTWA